MKRYKSGLLYHFIILVLICQVLAFSFSIKTEVNAASNSLEITCPTEIKPATPATCTISSNSAIKINKISGILSAENLSISDIKSEGTWAIEESDKTLNAKSSTEISGESKIASFKITATTPDSTSKLAVEKLVFENEEKYAYSVAGPLIEIKTLSASQTPTCADDEELVDGICQKKAPTCKDDEELVDGTCKKKTPVCKDDEELVNGSCQKKVVTPTCKSDETLKNNKCVKKEPDYLLIGIIAGSSVLVIGTIIAIIVLNKRKKADKKSKPGTYLNLSHGGLRGQGGGNGTNPVTAAPGQKYDNGSYMSKTGQAVEVGTTPPKNEDPKLQMQINRSSESKELQKKQLLSEEGQTNPDLQQNPNDPRLQIQFNNKQQEMKLKQDPKTAQTTSAYSPTSQTTAHPNESLSPYGSTKPVELSKPTTPDVFES